MRSVDTTPAIGAHRLLGDGRTAALIRDDAHIDWWCTPYLDSPPVCWSLLDPNGGRSRWCDVRLIDASDGPAGPAIKTTVRTPFGRVECWDALLPRAPHGSALVRLVRALDGDGELDHELLLGGFDAPWASWSGSTARVGQLVLHVDGGCTTVLDDVAITRVVLVDQQWAAVVINPEPAAVEIDELVDEVRRVQEQAMDATALARLPRRNGRRAAEALDVLVACTDADSGAPVTSPTTSLPEAPGGDRQFDYRYTWLRDSSLALSVAALLGRRDLAARYLHFLQRLGPEGILSAPVRDLRGRNGPDEREVEGVAGWGGSLPIRVGNAAADQLQYDAIRSVLEAVSVYLQTGGRLDRRTWEIVQVLADRAAEPPEPCSAGIWELRDPKPLVSADIGRWVALDRALWIARTWRPRTRRRRWRTARADAKQRSEAALLPDGGLPQSYGDDQADASALLAVILRIFDRRDPRAARLVDATLAALGSGPFLYRYEPGGDDGFHGVEGAFVPASWWAVSALAAVGRVDDAAARADALCAALPPLLSEEIDPSSRLSLGNTPLLWSHMEAARAVYLLDTATIRRRWGVVGLTAWRISRYLRLRRQTHKDAVEVSGLFSTGR